MGSHLLGGWVAEWTVGLSVPKTNLSFQLIGKVEAELGNTLFDGKYSVKYNVLFIWRPPSQGPTRIVGARTL